MSAPTRSDLNEEFNPIGGLLAALGITDTVAQIMAAKNGAPVECLYEDDALNELTPELWDAVKILIGTADESARTISDKMDASLHGFLNQVLWLRSSVAKTYERRQDRSNTIEADEKNAALLSSCHAVLRLTMMRLALKKYYEDKESV